MDIGHADAAGVSGNLGVMPLDREGDGGRSENAEVITVVGVLPDVFARENQVASEGLLKAGVKFISPSRREGRDPSAVAKEKRVQNVVAATRAGEHQIFVEWSLQDSRIGGAQYRIAALDVVGDADAGLGFLVSA